MPTVPKKPARAKSRISIHGLLALAGVCVLILAGIAGWWHQRAALLEKAPSAPPVPAAEPATPATAARFREQDSRIYAAYAGSGSCRECHLKAAEGWQNSHHALAEREVVSELDRFAFDPPQRFRHGSQTSSSRVVGNRYEIVTMGLNGQAQPFPVSRLIGVEPLRQCLIAAPGGRLQVSEIAFDPQRKDWFDVYGEEDRQAGEWGHWTGRGMNWNSMCAICHNTRLQKNYDPASDTFHTARVEMGVGCEACHGPAKAHVDWQRANTKASPARQRAEAVSLRFAKEQILHLCGSCHSRRSDFTGDFHPGENYYDHYSPVIPSETEVYYPDGQVRDEDFEFVSFIGSRMYSVGVRCLDCHDPHTGKTVAKDNALCLRCHQATIDPLAHGHHPLDKGGSLCRDCHMPITVYMARHPRHDHGLTIPDPMLTRDYQVPNACSRCHTDKPLQWSIDYVQQWYGDRLDRHTQRRARWLARARKGDLTVKDDLIKLAQSERLPLWRAIAAGQLRLWGNDESILAVLLESTRDPTPLVRGTAARSLGGFVGPRNPAVAPVLQRLLKDPQRMVRVEAAWGLRSILDTNSVAGAEFVRQMEYNADQPNALMQQAVFNLDRGQPETALSCFRRAIGWDGGSAPLRQGLAVCLSVLGRAAEAVPELEKACALDGKSADLRFNLGQALAETGQLTKAIAAFEKSVALDPNYGRAWYNLGLARSQAGEPEGALLALAKAEILEPRSADIPYAQATILYQQGRRREARMAARRSLELDPNRNDAAQLLQMTQ